MFGLGKSTDFSRAGIGFNIGKDGFGVTAYNDTGVKLALGDIVALIFTGTSGQELKAIIPVTNSIPGYIGVVCDPEGIESAAIGKVQIYGKCQARVLGNASLTGANKYLEVMNRIAYDSTIGTTYFVAGSGTTRDTITDAESGFVTDGFLAGMRIAVTGATTSGNNGSYEIYSVAAATLTLTSIGTLTSEVCSAATTILTHGYLEYTGTADAAETFAVSREAYTTTTIAALKWVQLTGLPKVIAAS